MHVCLCEAPRKRQGSLVEGLCGPSGPGSPPGSCPISVSPVLVVGVFLVEALIMGLHVAQAGVVIGVNKGQVNLEAESRAAVDTASGSHPTPDVPSPGLWTERARVKLPCAHPSVLPWLVLCSGSRGHPSTPPLLRPCPLLPPPTVPRQPLLLPALSFAPFQHSSRPRPPKAFSALPHGCPQPLPLSPLDPGAQQDPAPGASVRARGSPRRSSTSPAPCL